MVTMEPPVGFDAGAIRSKKAELLVAIPEVQPSKAVRGQYGAGTVLGKRTNGCLDGFTVVAQHASPASRLMYDMGTRVLPSNRVLRN
jgi:glucose-6-phosphate 1-dehydrogenase